MVSRHWRARQALPSIPRFPASALALAIGCALAGPLAQAAEPAARAASRGYAIAGGKLGDVLAEFAALSGVQLVFDPQTLAGRGSKGLQGAYGVPEGFARLLDGSGYEAVESGPGRYSLRAVPPLPAAPAPAAGDGAAREATLPAVRVAAVADARDGTTEHTGSYTTRSSRTATKLDLSLRETPQTVTVVTRQKMDDFGLTSVDNVLESTSAVSTLRAGNNGVSYYSRGFALQSQYDGMPNPIGIGESNAAASPDTAFLDKVEILQGASGLMAGAGDPGGTINLVRKRPTEHTQASVEATLGSWNKRRLVADVSGSLIESGRIRGRLVALVDNSNSFTKYVFDNKQGFYGIVDADLTPTTTIAASVMYQRNKFNDHYGVPMGGNGADLGLPRSSFYGVKNGDSTRESTSYALALDQKLPRDWLLKAAYTRSETKVDKITNFLTGSVDVSTGDGLELGRAPIQRKISSDTFDIYATGPFYLFDRKHELVVGATSTKMREKSKDPTYDWSNINIYNFDPNSISRPSSTNLSDWPEANETVQRGFYGAVRLSISDPLKLILGTRSSHYQYKAAGVTKQKEDSVITPYAGLVYNINNSTSFYASYSDIFKPQSNLKFGGGTIYPIVGKNYEAGIKSELLQDRLNVMAAVFQLEQTNLAQVDPSALPTACNGGRCFTAAGLVISKGIDLGINGALTPNLQIGAGYTYVESEYGNGSNKGQDYRTYLPKHILRAYTTYRIPSTDWTIGGNIRVQSDTYSTGTDWTGTNYNIKQGGVTIIGLMAKYQINKQAELGMSINNIFDRRYYESIGSFSTSMENFYGAPRSLAVNLKYNF